ncbi:MAG: hypothetical protein FWD49_05680 [Firmicutes bacterium]|nr:hypothetical protein [Bacillota bacterium]
MKKFLCAVLIIAVLGAGAVILTACNDDKAPDLSHIYAEIREDYEFSVGDVWNQNAINLVAVFKDGSRQQDIPLRNEDKVTVDISGLNLDSDNKFTEAGEKIIKINLLNRYDYELKIEVK